MANIVLFNISKTWGGGEAWHFQVAMSLQQRGHQVALLVLKSSDLANRAKQHELRTYEFEFNKLSFLNPFKIRAFRDCLKDLRPDVFIMNGSQELKLGAKVAHELSIKRIVYRRGSPTPIKAKKRTQKIFKDYLTDVLANSKHTFQTTFQFLKKEVELLQQHVIYNGIDLTKFNYTSPSLKEGIQDHIKLVHIGRLSEEKGQQDLIPLAEELKKKQASFSIHLAGKGPLESTLQEEIERKELTDCIHLDGFISEMSDYLSNKHVLLMTSKWEGFGFMMVEAMACGLPVIAYDIPVSHEVVKDQHTGFVIPSGNIPAFSDQVEYFQQHPMIYKNLSEQARAWVEANFVWEKKVDELCEALF